jgi:hypothetical protein
MPVRQVAAQIDNSSDRPTGEENSGEGMAIKHEARKDFPHVSAPLGNNLRPKTRQNGELLEQGEKAVTWFVAEEHSFGHFRIRRRRQDADRIHRETKALPFQVAAWPGYPFKPLSQISS